MSGLIDKIEEIISKTETDLNNLKNFKALVIEEISKFTDKIDSLEKDLKLSEKKNKETTKLEKENTALKSEIDDINSQFNKISKLYQEMSQKKEETINVRDLLSIYIVLLEEVFEGRPHAKILFLLHGDTQSISREALTKATGFQPATILHSIHDLNRAELVDYDNEADTITLKKKLY